MRQDVNKIAGTTRYTVPFAVTVQPRSFRNSKSSLTLSERKVEEFWCKSYLKGDNYHAANGFYHGTPCPSQLVILYQLISVYVDTGISSVNAMIHLTNNIDTLYCMHNRFCFVKILQMSKVTCTSRIAKK